LKRETFAFSKKSRKFKTRKKPREFKARKTQIFSKIKIFRKFVILSIILFLVMKVGDSGQKKMKIWLVPLGQAREIKLDFLIEPLAEIFQAEIKLHPPLEIPREAYNSRRGQYLSSFILRKMRSDLNLGPGEKALLIADVDLYAEGLNFVFGEAEINGSLAIISVARLRESFYGLPENEDIFTTRIKKEALHELGHVFGLRHCSFPGCVMNFSNSLADTDRKSAGFCPSCLSLLRKSKQ